MLKIIQKSTLKYLIELFEYPLIICFMPVVVISFCNTKVINLVKTLIVFMYDSLLQTNWISFFPMSEP